MASIKFSASILIKRSIADVFDFTQDYGRRLEWDTFLKQADLVNGAVTAGKGVRAWCVAHNGLGMETEYVTFNRPHVTAIKMTRGPFLFKSFLGSWNFRMPDTKHTEVVFLYSFELRFPFHLGNAILKRILRNHVRQRLADLKQHLEYT